MFLLRAWQESAVEISRVDNQPLARMLRVSKRRRWQRDLTFAVLGLIRRVTVHQGGRCELFQGIQPCLLSCAYDELSKVTLGCSDRVTYDRSAALRHFGACAARRSLIDALGAYFSYLCVCTRTHKDHRARAKRSLVHLLSSSLMSRGCVRLPLRTLPLNALTTSCQLTRPFSACDREERPACDEKQV